MTAAATSDSPAFLASPARRSVALDVSLGLLLAVACTALYLPARSYGFINFDDRIYVADNPALQQGLTPAGIAHAVTGTVVRNWHPLTTLTELVLSGVFGPSAETFHTANAVLFGLSVGLLFAFLRVATGRTWAAAIAAGLWGLHPLRVESVTWVAELKDEMAAVTWTAALVAYALYARRRTPGRYAAVVALVVLALLAKPVTVTLPFALLLLDLWPLGRDRPAAGAGPWWGRRVAEKLPLLLLSAVVVYISIRAQGVPTLVSIPLSTRVGNALASVAIYLRQMVWPTGLALFYPHPWMLRHPVPVVPLAVGAVLLVGFSAVAVATVRRRPYLAVGWFWFVGTLLPVIGLLQAGEQAHADRFTLLPAMGVTVAVVWLVADWAAARVGRRAVAAAVAVVAAAALATLTVRQRSTWRTGADLWARADAVVPDNFVARAQRSQEALAAGDPAAAERLAAQAVGMAPDSAAAHAVLAAAYDARGQPKLAVDEYGTAVKLDPGNAMLRYTIGLFLSQHRSDASARAQLERAVKLEPSLAVARHELGVVLAREGEYPQAIGEFRRVLQDVPGNMQTEGDLADALRLDRRSAEALPYYRAAMAAGSRNPQWEAELAWLTAEDADATLDQLQPLAATAKDAVDQTGGREPFPLYAYSLVLIRLDRQDDAIAAAERAMAAARAAGQTAMADAIARRLPFYRRGLPGAAATQPTTATADGPDPLTTPAAIAPAP